MTSVQNGSNTKVFATLMEGMNTSKLTELGVSHEQLEGIMSQFQKLSLTPSDKAPRVRKEVAAEDRCMARTWGSKKEGNEGHGPQCSAKRCGGDYCKMHAKKAAETETPCTWRDGKKFGLFMGRIDRPLTGKDAGGKWQILWPVPEIQQQVEAEKAAGTFVLGENELKHKSKSSKGGGTKRVRTKKDPSTPKNKPAKKETAPKAPRGKNAYMWFADTVRAQFKSEIETASVAEGADEEDKAKVSAKGTAKVAEVAKLTGAAWAALSAEEKKPFEEQAAADKATKLAAFKATQLLKDASEIAGMPLAEAEALSTPASPPKAPEIAQFDKEASQIFSDDDADAEAEAEAEALLAQMDGVGEEGEVDEEGPWQFEVPEDHPLTEAEDENDGIAAKLSNGTIVVVSRDWYDMAPEEIADSEYEENMQGTLAEVIYPEDGGFITGTYTPKA